MLSKSSIDLCLCVGARCASLLLHVCVCVCCLFVRINVADCYPAWRQQPRLRFVVWSHDAGRLNVFGGWVHRSIRLYSRDKRDSYAWWRWRRTHELLVQPLKEVYKYMVLQWAIAMWINICWHLRSVFPVAWLAATAEKVKNSWLCRGQTKTLNMVRPCDTRIDSLECYNLQSSYAFSKNTRIIWINMIGSNGVGSDCVSQVASVNDHFLPIEYVSTITVSETPKQRCYCRCSKPDVEEPKYGRN